MNYKPMEQSVIRAEHPATNFINDIYKQSEAYFAQNGVKHIFILSASDKSSTTNTPSIQCME